MLKMKIIDNFLDPKNFKNVRDTMTGRLFPWYYAPCANSGKDNFSHLTYTFFTNEYTNPATGNMDLLKPILGKLNYTALIRVRANLTYPSINKKDFYHIDYDYKNTTTALYYLDNNGGTKFKVGSKIKHIKSKANRIVIFPSHIKHSVVRHSNNDQGRFIINFNYYTDDDC